MTRASGWILGLNPGFGGFNYHDPAAALVYRGEVVAAVEEERFTRRKASPGDFPTGAVRFCLDHSGIALADLEEIAVGYAPARWRERMGLEAFRALNQPGLLSMTTAAREGRPAEPRQAEDAMLAASVGLGEILQRSSAWRSDFTAAARVRERLALTAVPVTFVEHHLAHAASAYYPSEFEEATGLVLDGVGEVATASAWHASRNGFKRVREAQIPNSLGYLYAAVTEYLGFKGWDGEGKTMALAAYGGPHAPVSNAFAKVAGFREGHFEVSGFISDCLGHGLSLDLDRACSVLGRAFGRPRRQEDEPIDDFHRSVAWTVQDYLERAVVTFAEDAMEAAGSRHICAAGGVFLNCTLNRVLRESPGVDQLFVQPVAKDSGLAMGAALFRSMQSAASTRAALPKLALGPAWTMNDVAAALATWGVPYVTSPTLARDVAEILAREGVVLWFVGRAEFGPRALGHRSILADPRQPRLRDRINALVKERELWRPFAASIMEEHAPALLEGLDPGRRAPYMIETFRVKSEWRQRLAAVVHPADHTTRPQTVAAEHEPELHQLLTEFRQLTGVPALLNTSLNGRGEPLAHAPADAVRLFYTSNADALVLERALVVKRG